jgi:hypothetical protein
MHIYIYIYISNVAKESLGYIYSRHALVLDTPNFIRKTPLCHFYGFRDNDFKREMLKNIYIYINDATSRDFSFEHYILLTSIFFYLCLGRNNVYAAFDTIDIVSNITVISLQFLGVRSVFTDIDCHYDIIQRDIRQSPSYIYIYIYICMLCVFGPVK